MNYTISPPLSDWNYVIEHSNSNIYNSEIYINALEDMGWKHIKILIYDNGVPVSVIVGRYKPFLGVTKCLIVGGLGGSSPLIIEDLNKNEVMNILQYSLKSLQDVAKKNRIFQIKIHTPLHSEELWELYEKNNFKLTKKLYTPLIDISKTEECLWNNLNKKNRNAIRNAIRKEVKVVKLDSFEEFSKIKIEHQKVKQYKDTPLDELETLYRKFKKHCPNMCDLYFSEYNNEYLSTAFIWRYNNTIYYVYGASNEKSREFQASNLLHWEIILEANKQGYKTYNMWGGKIGDDSGTKFKMRFSNESQLVQINKYEKWTL